ncbi:hypothetical protein [Amycolatopsis regifaucium]|nr:hypothetical protein [Amycolatopsis regifaucium]
MSSTTNRRARPGRRWASSTRPGRPVPHQIRPVPEEIRHVVGHRGR